MTIPPVEHVVDLAAPADVGLYAASTLIDTPPTRFYGGVRVWPTNCEPAAGAWPADPCADTGDLEKDGTRPGPGEPFDPIVVWGYDECAPDEPDAAITERATANMRRGERPIVEAAFAERALSDAADTITAETVVAGVSAAEAALAPMLTRGVLHADPALAAYLDTLGLIQRSGNVLRSPLGHRWSFGSGYRDADGFTPSTIIATGPVTVWRDAITASTALSPHEHVRVAVAERTVLPWYECAPVAVQINADGGGPVAMRPGDYPGAQTFPGTE